MCFLLLFYLVVFQSISGVRHFFGAKDIPGVNDFMPKVITASIGATAVEEIFLGEKSPVLYNGQPIGVILADSFDLANKAAKRVKITYKLADEGMYVNGHSVTIINVTLLFLY